MQAPPIHGTARGPRRSLSTSGIPACRRSAATLPKASSLRTAPSRAHAPTLRRRGAGSKDGGRLDQLQLYRDAPPADFRGGETLEASECPATHTWSNMLLGYCRLLSLCGRHRSVVEARAGLPHESSRAAWGCHRCDEVRERSPSARATGSPIGGWIAAGTASIACRGLRKRA